MIALWRGALPLSRAFWEFAVIYGLIASIVATGAAAAALMMDLPLLIAITLHLLPVPYFVVAVVGVWRSADRYRGEAVWASAARVMVMLWSVLMIAV